MENFLEVIKNNPKDDIKTYEIEIKLFNFVTRSYQNENWIIINSKYENSIKRTYSNVTFDIYNLGKGPDDLLYYWTEDKLNRIQLCAKKNYYGEYSVFIGSIWKCNSTKYKDGCLGEIIMSYKWP